MISLITPTQGNPVALKRTIDSMVGIVDEVVVGSVCIFPSDEETILSYSTQELPVRLMKFPFNYIFKKGFSSMLNELAGVAKNDLVVYLNVGEVLHKWREEIFNKISPSYNCYYLTHPVEKHLWYRFYNRKEVWWSGIIHEELMGNPVRPCSVPIFMFDDTPKDQEGQFYWKVMNDIKELCYWNQYMKLIDQPHLIANTNHNWVQFSRDGYHSFLERMHKKGKRYDAFLKGDLQMYLDDIEDNPEFVL